jgi:predicted DNA-binding transcriptional regulator YafY
LLLIIVPPAGVCGIVFGVLVILRTNKKVESWLLKFTEKLKQKEKSVSKMKSKASESHNDKTVFIEYEDANGNFSDRTIDIHRVYRKGGKLYIDAYCYMQGDDRTFLVDRILSMRETRKGPKITDIETYLHQLYKKSPSGPSAADLAALAQEDDK